MPFAHAVRELAAFTHVHVHASTARRTTEAAGATLVALQTQNAAHILATAPAEPPAAAAAMVVSHPKGPRWGILDPMTCTVDPPEWSTLRP